MQRRRKYIMQAAASSGLAQLAKEKENEKVNENEKENKKEKEKERENEKEKNNEIPYGVRTALPLFPLP